MTRTIEILKRKRVLETSKKYMDAQLKKKISISFTDYFKTIHNPDYVFFQPDEESLYFNERFFMGEFQCMFAESSILLHI